MNLKKICYSAFLSSLTFLTSAQTGDSIGAFKKEDNNEIVQSTIKKAKLLAEISTTSVHPQRRIVNGSTKASIKNTASLNTNKDDFSPAFYPGISPKQNNRKLLLQNKHPPFPLLEYQ